MARMFATGRKAVGYCRRCGDKVKLHTLRPDGENNLLVCEECYDIRHPAKTPIDTSDAMMVKNPAINLDVVASRTLADDRPLGEVLFGAGNYFGE